MNIGNNRQLAVMMQFRNLYWKIPSNRSVAWISPWKRMMDSLDIHHISPYFTISKSLRNCSADFQVIGLTAYLTVDSRQESRPTAAVQLDQGQNHVARLGRCSRPEFSWVAMFPKKVAPRWYMMVPKVSQSVNRWHSGPWMDVDSPISM